MYRIAGEGTKEFSGLTAGDTIDVLGPLGNGFPLEAGKKAFLIGGGIGVPPMLELAKALHCSISTAQRIKSSGVIDAAISQNGKVVVIDVERALDILRVSNKKWGRK